MKIPSLQDHNTMFKALLGKA